MAAKASELYDAVVIGGGPAGLTAALYLARACCRVLVVEKETFGGQIALTAEVVNYPGSDPTSGADLTAKMHRQAEGFGAEFLLAEVNSLEKKGDTWHVHTSRGDYEAFTVLLATGAHPRQIGFAGEKEFRGHGVAYCATCDGEFFTGKDVFVIGGGFAAAEESVFLTKYAKHVTILVREEDFTCAPATAQPARDNEKISIHFQTEVESVEGDALPRKLTWKNLATGERTVFTPEGGDSFGVFVFAGYQPSTDLVKGLAELDEHGYIVTDRQQRTTVEGLYAAGDVCIKPLRQVVTATGDGALAATEMEKYAMKMEEKTGRRTDHKVCRAAQHTAKDTGKDEGKGAATASTSGPFTADMKKQLMTVFDRMERPLHLEVALSDDPRSSELLDFMTQLAEMTDKLSVEITGGMGVPNVRIYNADGSWAGLAFHGVPGGHEFTSFVLGLYNASSAGQKVADEDLARIEKIKEDHHITIMVSLSCTMCPELVTSAQRIATLNPHVKTDVYDLSLFPEIKEQYNIMSVPCFFIDDDAKFYFGKKNISQLLDLLEQEEANA